MALRRVVAAAVALAIEIAAVPSEAAVAVLRLPPAPVAAVGSGGLAAASMPVGVPPAGAPVALPVLPQMTASFLSAVPDSAAAADLGAEPGEPGPAEADADGSAAVFDGARTASLGGGEGTSGVLSRAGRIAARTTGVSALWSIWRDGVLLQRYAARLSDESASPSRRAAAARMLASLGGVQAALLLGRTQERDASPVVRRAARAGLLRMAGSAAPRLIRALKTRVFPSSREAAATSLGWIARHVELREAIEALGRAGLMDRSEGVRLAAIRALGEARSPKAAATLSWMLAVENEPRMISALERALADAHARQAAGGRRHLVPPVEDLPMAASPLHAAALKSSIAVGLTFAVVEFVGGAVTGTLALKADALHLAGDRALDAAALLSMWLARRPPTSRHTYGWLKAEAIFALLGAAAIAGMGLSMIPGVVEGFLRPAPSAGWDVVGYAALSLASNLVSALMLRRHKDAHLGLRGAFLHALTDAAGTFGIIAAAVAGILWGWSFLMPLASGALVMMILRVAWELGRPAWDVLIDSVPPGVSVDRLEADLRAVPGVSLVYDLHVRALSSSGAELAAKLYARPGADHAAILAAANAFLRDRYGIVHSTIQIETAPPAP